MKIEIDFNKKEIVLLEPTSLKDLSSILGVSDFKIVSKHTNQLTWTQLQEIEGKPGLLINDPREYPYNRSGGTIGNNYYKTEGMTSTFGQRSEDC